VSIIVLNFNGGNDTIKCIESLLNLNYDECQIIVVDNNSQDDSVNALDRWFSKHYQVKTISNSCQRKGVKTICHYYDKLNGKRINIKSAVFIVNNENLGFAAGNNIAIKYCLEESASDFIWLLNNDTVVEKDSLTNLLEKMRNNHRLGICGSKIINIYSNEIQSIGTKLNKITGLLKIINNEEKANEIDSIQGASFFISAQCIKNVGLLPEEYFLYFEESDYCLKAFSLGFYTAVALNSIVYHKEGTTTGASGDHKKRSLFVDVLCLRNRLIFADKYLKVKIFMYFGMVYSGILRLLRGQPKVFFIIIKFLIASMKNINTLKQLYSVETIKDMINE